MLDLAMREAVQLAQTSGVLKAVDGFLPPRGGVRFEKGSGGALFCDTEQKMRVPPTNFEGSLLLTLFRGGIKGKLKGNQQVRGF